MVKNPNKGYTDFSPSSSSSSSRPALLRSRSVQHQRRKTPEEIEMLPPTVPKPRWGKIKTTQSPSQSQPPPGPGSAIYISSLFAFLMVRAVETFLGSIVFCYDESLLGPEMLAIKFTSF